MPEIDLLVDEIGIIEKGKLIQESSLEELEKKCQKSVKIVVSSTTKAAEVLERDLAIRNYRVVLENTILVYEFYQSTFTINKRLQENDIEVIEISILKETLEDYFKMIIGGSQIA